MSPGEDDRVPEVLAVEIVEEHWNEYLLEDGSRIRARSIPGTIVWPEKDVFGPGETFEVGARFIQVIVVIAPRAVRGTPNPRPPSIAEAQKMPLKKVSVAEATEPWNIYKLRGRELRMRVRMTITSVFRVTDVFDVNGDPYYIVNSTVAMGPSQQDETSAHPR